MRNKITSVADAVAIVQSGDTITTSGFVGVGTPDELLLALEVRPRSSTLRAPDAHESIQPLKDAAH